MGLHRAGFDVYGIDRDRQPNYPFWFRRGDVLALAPGDLAGFDLVWASPPCQAHSAGNRWQRKAGLVEHPCIIAPVRDLLAASGALYCMENVPDAPLRADLRLDGPMFGLCVFRRRHFEMNFRAMQPQLSGRVGPKTDSAFVSVVGSGGKRDGDLATWRAAMGIDWMSRREIVEAIPPAYAEYIGRAALATLAGATSGPDLDRFAGPHAAPAISPSAIAAAAWRGPFDQAGAGRAQPELGQARPVAAGPDVASSGVLPRGHVRPSQITLEEAIAERAA